MEPSLGTIIRTPLLPEEQGRQRSVSADVKLSRAPSLTVFTSGAGFGTVKNKPLIFLEIITGRIMLCIMLVTLLTFVLCQWLDYESILNGAQKSSFYSLGSRPCSPVYSQSTGCFNDLIWEGKVSRRVRCPGSSSFSIRHYHSCWLDLTIPSHLLL